MLPSGCRFRRYLVFFASLHIVQLGLDLGSKQGEMGISGKLLIVVHQIYPEIRKATNSTRSHVRPGRVCKKASKVLDSILHTQDQLCARY